jgi:hypothetical protein
MHEKETTNSDTVTDEAIPEGEASHSDSDTNPGINAHSCPPPVPNLAVSSRPPNQYVSPLTMPSTEASSALEVRRVSIHSISFPKTDNGLQLSIPMPAHQEITQTFKESYNVGYDSNGELGPFFDTVAGEQYDSSDEEEEDTPAGTPAEPVANNDAPAEPMANNDTPAKPVATNATPAEPSAINDAPAINEATSNLMTAAQLKEQLKYRKLSQNEGKS